MIPNVLHDPSLNAELGKLEIFEYGSNITYIIVPLLKYLEHYNVTI